MSGGPVDDFAAKIARIVDAAEAVAQSHGGGETPPHTKSDGSDFGEDGTRSGPSERGGEAGDPPDDDGFEPWYGSDDDLPDDRGAGDGEGVDAEAVASCAGLDHSDTDNGQRLIAHFGRDLLVLEQEGARNTDYLAWAGTHWDMLAGNDAAFRTAQRVGGLIRLEADYLAATPAERRAIDAAAEGRRDLDALEARKADWNDDDKSKARSLEAAIAAGRAAREALDKRKVARRKFGVSSKNKARMDAMLACAAPHLTRKPDQFNADPLVFATKGHTIRFVREADPECPDPDVTRYLTRIDAAPGHCRDDLISKLVPVDYRARATCPKWQAFLAEFLPSESARGAVQVLAGLGLLGMTVQKLVFHYGFGANGKSVFLETLVRVLGGLAIGLPSESITGTNERGAGQASPDLARIYGARFMRVLELPPDKPLAEDLVKKLTGGEAITVRTLFKGFFEFKPAFIGHMSGNGYPRIDGTDNGIWRRMVVIHWPVTIAEERQRPFDDVVADFAPEYPGILNWLMDGALTYLTEGLVLPADVLAATQEYRDEMDDIGEFSRACVRAEAESSVQSSSMYEAYQAWCHANAKRPKSQQKFGRVMKTKWPRDDSGARHFYTDCILHDVPEPPASRNPEGRWDK